jgi:hypothetical protein
MAQGSDGVFVAAPAWHQFMEQSLKGVPDHWYSKPADVTQKGTSYFLTGNPMTINHMAGDNPSASPSPNAGNGIPPDPGSGPRPVNQLCLPPLRIPGCPTPGGGQPPIGG